MPAVRMAWARRAWALPRVAGAPALGMLLAAAGCPAAHAADLQVSPISLQFAAAEQAQGLWLSNTGTQPLRAQVRVQRWFQGNDGDQLEAARDLVASPPSLEIAPGQRQLVRIVRPQPATAAQERSYRLIVDELPAGSGSALNSQPLAAPAQGLQFLLRYSIPVFVAPQGPAAPVPKQSDLRSLSAQLTVGAQTHLSVANAGARRVRISQLVYEDSQGRRVMLVAGLLGYVLAGQQMRWVLPAAARGATSGVLKARFNDDEQEQAFPPAVPSS
jgi:fimbrial chaperone protein